MNIDAQGEPEWVAEVNRFWFETLEPKDWFEPTATLDDSIRQRFEPLWRSLRGHVPVAATRTAAGAVASVIVLDQFPRNMFRGRPDTYATDAAARAVATAAIDAGLDQDAEPPMRRFLYMPFMHSEDPAEQRRSLSLFAALGDDDTMKFARHHAGIVERFGRFPHRNAILGRASTAEELAFLAAASVIPAKAGIQL